MRKLNYLPVIAVLFAGLNACTQNTSNNTAGTDSSSADMDTAMTTGQPIALEPVDNSTKFPGAALTITSMQSKKISDDSASLTVNYGIKNFELTKQTSDSHAEHANNSAQGQHIHFILDNKPYIALYKPAHTDTVALNSEHYLLSFLSRSYHESIKEKSAAVLRHFKIGADGALQEMDVPNEPMLFYSRPKGAYSGKDTENVLLDFYVWNTTLSANGNKVRVSVNDTTFTVDNWQPYFIKNAAKGDLNVKIDLLDNSGNAMSGENTSVERTATLK